MMLLEAEKLDFNDLRRGLSALSGIKVHVIGDIIVDGYTHCTMIGGMTKTPTMSVRFEEQQDYVGGAGIVAKHLKAAGADITFSTILGDDKHGQFALEDLNTAGVRCAPIIDRTRPTTHKNAIVAGGYRLLKVDKVDNRSISERIVQTLAEQIRDTATDIVVFSDFRHGIFNRDTIQPLSAAMPKETLRIADSQVASRWGNILEFEGFDLITPNEREARFALGDQDSTIRPLARELYRRARCKTLILKLGERGIITYRSLEALDPRAFFSVDSFVDRVVDAVGAGDALLAYAGLAQAATANVVIASVLGTLSAGVECEKEGNIPVGPADVVHKLDNIERIARYS